MFGSKLPNPVDRRFNFPVTCVLSLCISVPTIICESLLLAPLPKWPSIYSSSSNTDHLDDDATKVGSSELSFFCLSCLKIFFLVSTLPDSFPPLKFSLQPNLFLGLVFYYYSLSSMAHNPPYLFLLIFVGPLCQTSD